MSIVPKEADALALCSVITLGINPERGEALVALAHRVGFVHAVEYHHPDGLPKDALSFYFIDGQTPNGVKARLLNSIRSSNNPRRRFAPIVCVVPSGPRHQFVPLIDMGFDEVLFVGDSSESMTHKLVGQLHHELLYVETGRYFGPDRRRIEVIDPADPRRKSSKGSFRKIKVVRDPATGIHASLIPADV